jgi:hypothetical protein
MNVKNINSFLPVGRARKAFISLSIIIVIFLSPAEISRAWVIN